MIITSDQYDITRNDVLKWMDNQQEFLKPLVLVVATLYFPPILALLSNPEYVISLSDFVPSNAVYLAVAFYLVNATYDFVRKWAGTNKYTI